MSSNSNSLSSFQLEDSQSMIAEQQPKSVGNSRSFEIDLVPVSEIGGELERFWMELHESDLQLRSPNYHPDFTRAVAAVRDDVKVAVMRSRKGTILGILPFQQLTDQLADPVGGRMNDYHGMLLAPGVNFDIGTLLHRIEIRRFEFHSVSANREQFERYQFVTLPSYSVDLSEGRDHYLNWARKNSKTLSRLPQKVRALERDHGPVRFEYDCDSAEVLEKLIQLKRDKYVRTNTFDILSVDWAANLLRKIHHFKKHDFRGILSVMWAQDAVVAAHFGMIAGDVMQYWFPVFDNRYSKYSPGLQLMMNCIRCASGSGIERIDLSYGHSKFKVLFANEEEDVLYGQVNFDPIRFQVAKQRYRLRMKLKELPFIEQAKFLLRKVYPGYGRWHFK